MTPDLDAIRARLEQVEADRDRWKQAYDMAARRLRAVLEGTDS